MRKYLAVAAASLALQGCSPGTQTDVISLADGACFNAPEGNIVQATLPEIVDCESAHQHQVLARITLLGQTEVEGRQEEARIACESIVARTTGGRPLQTGTTLTVLLQRTSPRAQTQDAVCLISHAIPRVGAL